MLTNRLSDPKTDFASGKLEFLDGIRGIMALNVVLCHFVCVYYPEMYYLDFAESAGGVLSLFATTPLTLLVNGNIAVQYFFVLTGFLVGRTFFVKNLSAQTIAGRGVKRYFRLLPMVFAATVFTFLTMRLGLQYHLQINDMVRNTYFLKDYCNFVERLISLPGEIFVNPFFMTGSRYVGPFWTIRIEFWGYIFAMVVCVILREQKYRYVQYLLIILVLPRTSLYSYFPVLLGVFVADLLFNDAPAFRRKPGAGLRKVIRCGLLVLGLYLISCPMYFTGIHSILQKIPYCGTDMVRAVGIAILIFLMTEAPKVQKFFSHPLFLKIGEHSFEIYAFHWPLMLSLQAWLFWRLSGRYSYHTAAIAAFLLTVPVIFLTAFLVHRLLKLCTAVTERCKAKL